MCICSFFQQTTNPSIITEERDAVTDPITAISESVRRNGTVTGQELAEETPSRHPVAREDKAVTDLNWFSQYLVMWLLGESSAPVQ